MCAGASGCLLTFILGYNSLNDRLKDLEKEGRERAREEEKEQEAVGQGHLCPGPGNLTLNR